MTGNGEDIKFEENEKTKPNVENFSDMDRRIQSIEKTHYFLSKGAYWLYIIGGSLIILFFWYLNSKFETVNTKIYYLEKRIQQNENLIQKQVEFNYRILKEFKRIK